MELPSRRKRGTLQRRFRVLVKDDIKGIGVIEDDANDWVIWKHRVRCGDLSIESSRK